MTKGVKMSDAIEVLKSKKSICDLCKYDNDKSCDASGGEFNECNSAEGFYNAIQEAIVALEKQEKLKEWLEKEIVFWKVEVEKSKDTEKFEDYVQDINEQRLWAYQLVLSKLKGEQK